MTLREGSPTSPALSTATVEATSKRLRELGAVFHSITEGLVFVTPERQVAEMNPAALEMYGFASVQEARRSLDELTQIFCAWDLEGRPIPDDRRPAARALRGESFADVELRVRRAGSDEEWIGSFSGGPVFSGSGKIALAVVTIRDITARARAEDERRRVEDALRVSEERFRTAISASPLVVFNQDTDLRYTWIHNPAEGPYSAGVLGKTDVEVLARPEDARHLEELKREVIESGRGMREQVSLQLGGRLCRYDLTLEPLRDADGRVTGVTGAAMDITRHVELEERLRRQTARLAEDDRRKDEFLAMLAHELRSPLAPIRNAAEALRLRREKDDAAPEREVLTIRRQVDQLARLVDDLLDVSRITRGIVELRTERVPLERIVSLAVETLGPVLEQRSGDLAIRLPDEPVTLEGDPVRLAQIVTNLLSNAAKYSEPGTPIELLGSVEDDRVALRIRDRGLGMSPKLLGQVFDLFFQVESSLDRSQGGLGLGLTLVKSLTEMHGGSVDAESEGPGCGSEFTVRLPVASPGDTAAAEAAPAAEADRHAGSLRVLAVDDNVDAAESFAELLRLTGHQAATAHEGEGALRMAASFRPDVVFLDLGLPGMDGFEVARRIRKLPGGDEILLVALTGYGQDESRRRSREAGFDHHLLKPVSLETVRELLASPADD